MLTVGSTARSKVGRTSTAWAAPAKRSSAMPRTLAGLAQTASAILAAPDPKACSHIFKKAVATFQVDTFACGEVDLEVRERTVLYVISWPESWRKFYMSSG